MMASVRYLQNEHNIVKTKHMINDSIKISTWALKNVRWQQQQ